MSLELICSGCGGPLMDGDQCPACPKDNIRKPQAALAEEALWGPVETADLMLEGDLFGG